MKKIPSSPDAVAAVWAISSPEAIAQAPLLPGMPGWKELRGKDTWVYMRLTKAAARVLAEQLLHAADDAADPEVVNGRPQGAWVDEVSEEWSGIFLHPVGASLTIRIADMPAIGALMEAHPTDSKLLSPVPGEDCHFSESGAP
jgi:hypothetical protein